MKSRLRILAVVSVLTTTEPAVAGLAPDFTSNQGMQKTCEVVAKKPAKRLRDDVEKAAWVICRDIDVLKRVAGFAHRRFERSGMPAQSLEDTVKDVVALLDELARELQTTRRVLETIRFTKPVLRLAPARWRVDLNGDGKLDLWERNFFAPPGRQAPVTTGFSLSDDAAYYREHTRDAVISVDQADVQWLLAYHNFLEGTLDYVLAYRLDLRAGKPEDMITLADGDRAARRSFERIRAGWAASRATLRELKRETDDHDEWIPNPRQKNSSFPLELNAKNFAAWEAVLDEVDVLLAGKALLALPGGAPSGPCRAGEGLDLRHLMTNPAVRPLAEGSLRASCRPLSKTQRASRLPAMAEEARAAFRSAGGDWALARYLYWIN